GPRRRRKCGERPRDRRRAPRPPDCRARLEGSRADLFRVGPGINRAALRPRVSLETPMDFDYAPQVKTLQARLTAFMDKHVYPNEARYYAETAGDDRWKPSALIEELKPKAKAAGLWNLFLPASARGAGLSNAEYAPLCEIMGRALFAPEIFNCSAPDTGNMEVLERYGTAEQKTRWLEPLLEGRIRSAFAMTEPDVASSDATNVKSSIVRDGDTYVINGR